MSENRGVDQVCVFRKSEGKSRPARKIWSGTLVGNQCALQSPSHRIPRVVGFRYNRREGDFLDEHAGSGLQRPTRHLR